MMPLGAGEERIAPVRYLPGARAEAESDAIVEQARAGDVAARALGRRDLSRREVEAELERAGLDDDIVRDELGRLTARGLLDDDRLAVELAERLQQRKGYGRQAVAAELARRRLSPGSIAAALDLVDDEAELERAVQLAETQLRRLDGLDQPVAMRRLSGYLARRGYSGSIVRIAVDRALGGGAR